MVHKVKATGKWQAWYRQSRWKHGTLRSSRSDGRETSGAAEGACGVQTAGARDAGVRMPAPAARTTSPATVVEPCVKHAVQKACRWNINRVQRVPQPAGTSLFEEKVIIIRQPATRTKTRNARKNTVRTFATSRNSRCRYMRVIQRSGAANKPKKMNYRTNQPGERSPRREEKRNKEPRTGRRTGSNRCGVPDLQRSTGGKQAEGSLLAFAEGNSSCKNPMLVWYPPAGQVGIHSTVW